MRITWVDDKAFMEDLPISVITVAKNAEETIGDCLISIKRNKPAEIIVVDGNSTDRTLRIARKYTQKLFSDGGKGLNYARQLGANMATQKYIAYIDSDVVLMDSTLSTMLRELQKSDYVGISARMATNFRCSTYWQWAQYQHHQLRESGKHGQIYGSKIGLSTNKGLFRRETILKYGFDLSARAPDLRARIDDLDLQIRLRKDGCEFGISSATVYVQYLKDPRDLIKHQFLYGRISTRVIQRYGPWNPRFWPPLYTLYWLEFYILKRKLILVPYLMTDSVSQTTGMLKGIFELTLEPFVRKMQYFAKNARCRMSTSLRYTQKPARAIVAGCQLAYTLGLEAFRV